MKLSTILISVSLLLLSTSLYAISNKEKIAEVKSGKCQEAHVEWWGFDKKDSTKYLQQAIDSGVKKLIISKMNFPWLISPIQLQSNQEIIFEKGVVIRAIPGKFKDVNDCLFQAKGKKNIILRGDATLMMNKKDYQNPKLYKFSEWRHTISLLSCENIKIIGLTLKDSGGDGIYIGRFRKKDEKIPAYCKNILIDKVMCDNHHRQGISVISVENLLIRGTKMNNTSGAAPMAGIDFEPNYDSERLVNCVMENCTMDNNASYGFVIYSKLSSRAKPISITVKDCSIQNGLWGIAVSMSKNLKNPASGYVKFINCKVSNTSDSCIQFENFCSNGWKAIFDKCTLKNPASKKPGRSAITISLSPGSVVNTGNIEFDDCTVVDARKKALMQFANYAGKPIVEKVSGTIIYNGKKIDMGKYIKNNKMDISNPLTIAPFQQNSLSPLGGYKLQKRYDTNTRLMFRQKVRFLIAAGKDKVVKFCLKYDKVYKHKKKVFMKTILLTPSGQNIKLVDAVIGENNNYSFVAPEKGVYQLICNPKGDIIQFLDCNSPFSIATPENKALDIHRASGRIFFGIPQNVKEFFIEVSGDGPETIDAKVYIGEKLITSANNISSPKVFSIKCNTGNKFQVGSILLTNAVEDARIKLAAPLLPIFSKNKSELMFISRK